MNLQRLYGPVIAVIRSTEGTPELTVRMNPDFDILYIFTMAPEPKMEIAFDPTGVVILDEKRDPEDHEIVIESLTIPPNPYYRYEFNNGSSKPHSVSFEYTEGEVEYSFYMPTKDIRKFVDYNHFINAEIEIAIDMIKRGIPETIRIQSNFNKD